LGKGVIGRALHQGTWQLRPINLRDFGVGRHRCVDDMPAGGGPGMVIRADVAAAAIEHTLAQAASCPKAAPLPLVALSPRGRPFDQKQARRWAQGDGVILLCGRFEGIDQRVLDAFAMEEVSLGDFVMTGGEIAAQAMIEATVRLLPSVLGNAASLGEESHCGPLLEHPQYTRPAQWRGREIPAVLTGGHHGEVAKWRRTMAEELTRRRRPDLWALYRGGRSLSGKKDQGEDG